MMQLVPLALVFVPVVTALVVYLCKKRDIHVLALFAQALMTALAIVYAIHYHGNFEATYIVLGGWEERIGISFYNDPTSLAFIFLSLFTWWMVLIYTFKKGKTDHAFLFFLMFLQGVFMGLLQTNDLFNMFVFIELITITVAILIAFRKAGESFRAAIYYLLLNTSGVLCYLIGLIVLYNAFGTINLRVLGEMTAVVGDTTAVRFAYVFMLAGISVKAAFFPVFTWLPKAHGVAQSAISALLSGLIVKGGLYLFIRINGMFVGSGIDATDFFFIIATVTAFVGIVFALTQKDIKQMLAYSTISQVGIVMMGLSYPAGSETYYGGFMHIFNHALFKSLLFMGAGIIIKTYRTKYVDEIRGVMRTMPAVGLFMIIGMLSITGAPFFNGFISKSVIKYGIMDQDYKYWLLFIANLGTATLFIKMSQIFFGPRPMSVPIKNVAERFALMGFAFACVLLGNAYLPIYVHVFDMNVGYVSAFAFEAFFDYAVALTLGFCLYKLFIAADRRAIRRIRSFTVSFESANVLFMVYIAVMSLVFILL